MQKLLIYIIVIFFFVLTDCSHKSEKDAIKIMTLNVRYDNPRDSINAWPNRAAQVCNFIIKEKPDILGMQEVLWRQYEVLDSVLKDYTSIGVGRDDGTRAGEMNPVFFRKERFDMVRTITFWLSNTPEIPGSRGWGASLPRIVTWMELVDKNNHEHFFYFNTHFAHDSDSARIMSSKILLNEVKKIAEGFPFIITGDFNMLRTSESYAILTGPAESVPLLKDSYTISEKRPLGPAYTFNGFSDKPGTGRIDYIFVRNGMKVLDHSTVIKKGKGIFISDHWPVKSTILIKDN
ncbi:MAG: endonuclease/exonuclease/phosphatase family protein [Bacteroidales bacterium]|nr:endonuclease/exonuclease/phosphatase family protein [Bacteroidales bacterium]